MRTEHIAEALCVHPIPIKRIVYPRQLPIFPGHFELRCLQLLMAMAQLPGNTILLAVATAKAIWITGTPEATNGCSFRTQPFFGSGNYTLSRYNPYCLCRRERSLKMTCSSATPFAKIISKSFAWAVHSSQFSRILCT